MNPKPSDDYIIREISEILDCQPLVSQKDLQFWQWMADYYMCSIGEVMKAALPGNLMVDNNSILSLNSNYSGQTKLTGNEAKIYEWLSVNKTGELTKIEKSLGIKNSFKVIHRLLEIKAIEVEDRISHKYSPKTETFVSLASLYRDEDVLNAFFETLKRAPKQEALLIKYFELCDEENDTYILRKHFSLKGNYGIYRALAKKGVFVEKEVEVSRLEEDLPTVEPNELSEKQQKAKEHILNAFKNKQVALLKGATASGKTEIYIQIIQEYINRGEQVLYLVPEISLTTQLSRRLKRVFGSKMAIFHSRYNPLRRAELWQSISQNNHVQLVLGARSAVFMPFKNLGLIVIDEEHERSLKQHDPSPRYHARDAAIMLAGIKNSKVLLGSSTPSLESWHNATSNKYALVELQERFNKSPEPDLQIIDMHAAYKKRKLKYHFSYELLDEMTRTLQSNAQVIIFQNRRGYAPVVECRNCGWVQKCHQCDVPLTWHFDKHLMGCHYCGHTKRVINTCPECGEEALMNKGAGTEKIEQELEELFPDASIKRFDADTAGGLTKMEKTIQAFEDGDIDILIGTQMVSRGLDFNNVQLVGVLNADNLFNFPDFRASERGWQMLMQVAGRSGRRKEQGKVIIQTHQPAHPVIKSVLLKSAEQLFEIELQERRMFKYPPFNRIIDIYLKHPNQNVVERCAMLYATTIRTELNERVLGPEAPGINKIKNWYQQRILIKATTSAELPHIKQYLLKCMEHLIKTKKIPASLRFHFDVDPQ